MGTKREKPLQPWTDADLLYALCVVCKRIDLANQGDEQLTVKQAFIDMAYSDREAEAVLDLIYQKVLE